MVKKKHVRQRISVAGSDDRLWTVRNSSDDRDRRVPCIQGIIYISGFTDIPSWNF